MPSKHLAMVSRFVYVQDVLIYGGIGINIVGDLFAMAYAMKYTYAFLKSKNNPIHTEAFKSKWAQIRVVAFGLIFLGIIIAIIGCII